MSFVFRDLQWILLRSAEWHRLSFFFIITPKETKSYLPNKELTLRVQPFQFRSQTPLQKGMPAEGTILQPVPDKLREGGAVVSALSALILHKFFVCFAYGYSTCEWSLLYIRAALRKTRGESHSPPRWRILTSEVKVDGILAYFKWINRSIVQKKNRGFVCLKQRFCLFLIEPLFGINTGSIETEVSSFRIFYLSGWRGWKHSPLSERARGGI